MVAKKDEQHSVGNIILFGEYQGTLIHASEAGEYDLTEMCLANGRQLNHFMDNADTKAFLQRYSEITGIPVISILKKIKTGHKGKPHTWGPEPVMLKMVAWLDTDFELWVYARIGELLKKGYTTISGANPSPTDQTGLLLAFISRMEERAQEREDRFFKMVEAIEARGRADYRAENQRGYRLLRDIIRSIWGDIPEREMRRTVDEITSRAGAENHEVFPSVPFSNENGQRIRRGVPLALHRESWSWAEDIIRRRKADYYANRPADARQQQTFRFSEEVVR